MTPDPRLERIGLAATDKFITTWNSRDPGAWAGSLNFPHARPAYHGGSAASARRHATDVIPDPASYIADVDFARVIATGWDHSRWDHRQVLHTSADKIHVAGQWSRYDQAGRRLLSNPITYIVTADPNQDGRWGIQSRFAADAFTPEQADDDHTHSGQRALDTVQMLIDALRNDDPEAAARHLNYPLLDVRPGNILVTTDADGFAPPARGRWHIASVLALQTGPHSVNMAVELHDDADGHRYETVMLITDDQDHFGVRAWSWINAQTTAAN